MMGQTSDRMTVQLLPGERLDDLQIQGYRIIQDPRRFCFGMDAVLLSWFAKAKPGDRVLDLGTGNGIIPILMAAKTRAAHLTGLEIQEASASMAARSVTLNGLDDRIDIVTGDLRQADTLLARHSFEVVTANPPYIKSGQGLLSAEDARAIARHEQLCTLDDVVCAASAMLFAGGHFFMVHRPERLSDVMTALTSHRLTPKTLTLVHPYADREPTLILIESVLDGGAGLKVTPPLMLYDSQGAWSRQLQAIYGHAGPERSIP